MQSAIAFLRRRIYGIPQPREWMLEVTNRCNLACPMCLRDKREFKIRDMDRGFIDHLLDTNPKPAALWPYGFGEPLMYTPIFEVVRRAKNRGILVSLSTNGTRLDENAGRELLESGLDYLIVAFDGATPQTYAKYRKGANFHQVKENVERFIRLKLARGSRLHLTLQMILMSGTASEATAFKQLWTRHGVDCVRIREDLLKDDRPEEVHKHAIRRRPCFFLWRGPLFVQAAGGMIPCPYYHGSESFGDLRSQTMEEAWNSPKMTELRQAHVSGDLSRFPICASCPRYQPHPLTAVLSFFTGTGAIRRYLPIAEALQRKLGRKFFE